VAAEGLEAGGSGLLGQRQHLDGDLTQPAGSPLRQVHAAAELIEHAVLADRQRAAVVGQEAFGLKWRQQAGGDHVGGGLGGFRRQRRATASCGQVLPQRFRLDHGVMRYLVDQLFAADVVRGHDSVLPDASSVAQNSWRRAEENRVVASDCARRAKPPGESESLAKTGNAVPWGAPEWHFRQCVRSRGATCEEMVWHLWRVWLWKEAD